MLQDDEQAAKMYLFQLLRMDEMIQSNIDEVSWLEATALTAHYYERDIDNVTGYAAEVKRETESFRGIKDDIIQTIEQIEGQVKRQIIKLRYLEKQNWMDIAEQMLYSEKQVVRIHRKVLTEVFQIIHRNTEFVQKY